MTRRIAPKTTASPKALKAQQERKEALLNVLRIRGAPFNRKELAVKDPATFRHLTKGAYARAAERYLATYITPRTLSLFDQHFAVVVPQVRLACRCSIRVGLNIHHTARLVLQVTPRAHITTFTAQRLVTFHTLALRFIVAIDAVFDLFMVKRAFKGHRFEGEFKRQCIHRDIIVRRYSGQLQNGAICSAHTPSIARSLLCASISDHETARRLA